MIDQRTYLPNGIVITDARMQDASRAASVVVDGSIHAYLHFEREFEDDETFREKLIRRVQSPENHAKLQRRFEERIRNSDIPVYVAWSRHGIVGVGGGEIDEYERHIVRTLYTIVQNNGIATALLDKINARQQQQGASFSSLQVVSHTPAVHYYERRGFTFCGAPEASKHPDGTYLHLTWMKTTLPRRPGRCLFDRLQRL